MIISRTPLRITLGGGGTDLPSYYQQFEGFVMSAAISKYVFVAANRKWGEGYLLKYSAHENVQTVEQIRHPIFREVLRRHSTLTNVELVSVADVPAGTGLGSSGAFTVGLLRALYGLKHEYVPAVAVAEEACEIEIDVLRQPVGKQDPYIASFGGITCFTFDAQGAVKVTRLALSSDTVCDLDHNLLMFFTGFSRNASDVLLDQQKRSLEGDSKMIDNLHFIKQLGLSSKEALESGRMKCYAELLREHWEHKRARSPGTSNDRIDRWHSIGLANGALGGKIVGAGGGGFLLFYADDPMRLRRAMAKEGLTELRFRFDYDGSTVMVRDE